jgi:nitroreductase
LSSESRPSLDPDWYSAIPGRVSRRRFDGTPIAPDDAARLAGLCERFRPFPDARAVFVEHAPAELFTGIAGSYGGVRGAPSAAVFIAGEGGDASAGYIGEAVILEATSLGLGTCWIAGNFDRAHAASVAAPGEGERVVSVTPVGRALPKPDAVETVMRRFVSSDRRKSLDVIAPSSKDADWPAWALVAVEAARLAPSGGNGQPWRFRMVDGALVLSGVGDAYWTAKLDYGIAMLHVELGAQHANVSGRWEQQASPDVARFVPDPGTG